MSEAMQFSLFQSTETAVDLSLAPLRSSSSFQENIHRLLPDHFDAPQSQPEFVTYMATLSAFASEQMSLQRQPLPGALSDEDAAVPQNTGSGIAENAINFEDGSVAKRPGDRIDDLQTQKASLLEDPVDFNADATLGSALSPLPSSKPDSHSESSCPPPAPRGHNILKAISITDKNGKQIIGGSGKPLYRPDDGHDPRFFNAEGLQDADSLERQEEDIKNFRGGGKWDEQRVGGDGVHITDSRFIDWSTVDIGIWGASTGIPEVAMQLTQEGYAFVKGRKYGNVPRSKWYPIMPQTNVDNLHLGYQLYENGSLSLCEKK